MYDLFFTWVQVGRWGIRGENVCFIFFIVGVGVSVQILEFRLKDEGGFGGIVWNRVILELRRFGGGVVLVRSGVGKSVRDEWIFSILDSKVNSGLLVSFFVLQMWEWIQKVEGFGLGFFRRQGLNLGFSFFVYGQGGSVGVSGLGCFSFRFLVDSREWVLRILSSFWGQEGS